MSRKSIKGAGYTSRNSGPARIILSNAAQPFRDGRHPFWAWLEGKEWERTEALGEWEFRRYRKGKEIAIFHLRNNGHLSASGHAARLVNGYFQAVKEG